MRAEALYMSVYKSILEGFIIPVEYAENEALPSERFFCLKYNVSRSTVRQALDKLQKDGYIYTIQGSGSYKKPQVFEQPLGKIYSFTDELKNCNILIHNKIISYELVALKDPMAAKLGYPEGSAFHKLVRLRSAKEYPLMLETTFLPKSRFHRINVAYLENHGSLYAYLKEKYDFHTERVVEEFRPVTASQGERELLCITANLPCFYLERYSYEEGELCEYTASVVRGDKFVFKVDLQ